MILGEIPARNARFADLRADGGRIMPTSYPRLQQPAIVKNTHRHSRVPSSRVIEN